MSLVVFFPLAAAEAFLSPPHLSLAVPAHADAKNPLAATASIANQLDAIMAGQVAALSEGEATNHKFMRLCGLLDTMQTALASFKEPVNAIEIKYEQKIATLDATVVNFQDEARSRSPSPDESVTYAPSDVSAPALSSLAEEEPAAHVQPRLRSPPPPRRSCSRTAHRGCPHPAHLNHSAQPGVLRHLGSATSRFSGVAASSANCI